MTKTTTNTEKAQASQNSPEQTVTVEVTSYRTYYKSQIFPRELDTDKPLGSVMFELPLVECVEYPHLARKGHEWFPAIERALKQRGAFPYLPNVGYAFGIRS